MLVKEQFHAGGITRSRRSRFGGEREAGSDVLPSESSWRLPCRPNEKGQGSRDPWPLERIQIGTGVNSAGADRTGGATGTWNLADNLTLFPHEFADLPGTSPRPQIFINH